MLVLEEYDECYTSTFDPYEVENVIEGFPKVGIACFSKKLFDSFLEKHDYEEIAKTSNGNGKLPVYKIKYKGKEVALFMARVGASSCAIQYEELLAMGMEKLVICGTCGVLDKDIEDLAIIIPNYAIRDEGASAISNNGCEAVKHARDCHIEWEKNNNFDPYEDWSRNKGE